MATGVARNCPNRNSRKGHLGPFTCTENDTLVQQANTKNNAHVDSVPFTETSNFVIHEKPRVGVSACLTWFVLISAFVSSVIAPFAHNVRSSSSKVSLCDCVLSF